MAYVGGNSGIRVPPDPVSHVRTDGDLPLRRIGHIPSREDHRRRTKKFRGATVIILSKSFTSQCFSARCSAHTPAIYGRLLTFQSCVESLNRYSDTRFPFAPGQTPGELELGYRVHPPVMAHSAVPSLHSFPGVHLLPYHT